MDLSMALSKQYTQFQRLFEDAPALSVDIISDWIEDKRRGYTLCNLQANR